MINTGKIRIIDDCYNANPNSMMASIDTLMNFDGRKIAVLGDMKELGKKELELHFEVGEYAKEKGADGILCIGPLAEELAKGAEGIWFETVEEFLAASGSYIREGDVVLVKASHSMQFEKIVKKLTEDFGGDAE